MNDCFDYNRKLTRRERILRKKASAITLPVSITAINFCFDVNTALLLRAAAAFGAKEVLIIGSVPERRFLQQLGGSVVDDVEIKQFSNVYRYLDYIRKNEIKMVALELYEGAKSLFDYDFDFNTQTTLVCGNESTGVSLDILLNSDIVYIPLTGIVHSLNVATCGTAVLTEYARQWTLYQRRNVGY